jgi:hypothetical protein
MPKPLFKPPKQLVKEWPEVFEDLYMNTMPVAYIDLLRLEFNDGRVWEIDVSDQLKVVDADSMAEKILSIFQDYREEIKKVDFKMDIERLKKDIKNSTDTLF